MLIPTIIICVQGVCFNPAMSVYLKPIDKEKGCQVRMSDIGYSENPVFKNTTCEALAAQINQKIKEQIK